MPCQISNTVINSLSQLHQDTIKDIFNCINKANVELKEKNLILGFADGKDYNQVMSDQNSYEMKNNKEGIKEPCVFISSVMKEKLFLTKKGNLNSYTRLSTYLTEKSFYKKS